MRLYKELFAAMAMMALTGCPYTEGCEGPGVAGGAPALPDAGPDASPLEGPRDVAPEPADAGPVGDPLPIDFGADPTGGPTLSTLACPALAMPKAVGTVYVDASATGPESGTKAAPFRTVEKAFASAGPRGVVWIAAGTYKENLIIPAKSLLVQGGFAPGFGARTDGCATILEAADPARPVLSANIEVKGFTMEGLSVQKGARGLSVMGEEDAPATFTVARCVFSHNGTKTTGGGGVTFDNVNARVFHNVFKDNIGSKGAALAFDGDLMSITIDQNLFDHNLGYADHGGGIYLTPKSAKVTRNTFRGNATGVDAVTGGSWGGAAIIDNAALDRPTRADFSYNVFTENCAGIGGGIFADQGSTLTLSHDVFYRNRAYPENGVLRGAAIYVDGTGLGPAGGSTFTGEYLTVANNAYDDKGKLGTSAAMFGGNIYVEGFSRAAISNSIFWNNGANGFYVESNSTLAISNSIGLNGCTSSNGGGLIHAAAEICKIGAGVFQPAAIHFGDEAADDYHEKSTAGRFSKGNWVLDAVTSPAIDKAETTATPADEPMPNGGRANLGAFARTMEASKSP